MPALLKAKSRRPKVLLVLSKAAFTSSACVTSHRTASARPPCPSIMRAVSWLSFSEMSATTTLAPSRAKASAAARPMPFAAPVTNATLPVKDPFLFIVTFCSFFAGLSRPILVVAHLFHPVDDLAVERFLNGDVRHCCRRRGAMPMFLVRREPDHIAGADLIDRSALALHSTADGVDVHLL